MPITEEQAALIFEKVSGGLSQKDACALAHVNYGTWKKAVDGDEPPHPDWRMKKDEAQALSVQKWLGKLEKATDEGKSVAGVTGATKMLFAIDPRFREDPKYKGGGTQIVFYVGKPEDVVRVVGANVVQNVLPAGEDRDAVGIADE